jgi:hypothetical protein
VELWQKYVESEPFNDGSVSGYIFVHVVKYDSSATSGWTPSGKPFDDYWKAYRSAQRQEKKINGYLMKQ